MKIVYLEITSWAGISLGATHYYGKLFLDWDNQVELTHNLTTKEAIELNKKQEWVRGGYRKGNSYYGFDSIEDITKLAIETYKIHFPKADALIMGNHADSDPQRVLDGPKDFMEKVNGWFLQANMIGWYKDKKEMDKISEEYWKYFCEVTKR